MAETLKIIGELDNGNYIATCSRLAKTTPLEPVVILDPKQLDFIKRSNKFTMKVQRDK